MLRLQRAFLAVATPIVIVGSVLALFIAPPWIAFEQDRSGVAAITGYTPAQVREATGSILSDLIVGPPAFTAQVDGEPVLGPDERSHMADVRRVLLAAALAFGAAAIVGAAILFRQRDSARAWRVVSRAAGGFAAVIGIIGALALVSFDTAFTLFHLVAFPQGNWAFDPRTQRLVQLFPEQFWSDTAIALAVAILVAAVVVAATARHMARRALR